MNRHHVRLFVPVVVIAMLSHAAALSAGDLNPPAGPVAPTHKTLTEVEPRTAISLANTPGDADSLFKITLPGSYYLTGNITGVVGKHGIEIIASGVTLDLNGFDLVGIAAMGAFDGVSVTVFPLTNIAVVNGSVRNWGGDGVDLRSFGATNCRVADLLASGNTGNGISVYSSCTVTNCSASSNTGNGISTTEGCTVSNCSAYANTVDGNTAFFGNACTVSNCSAYQNSGSGINAGRATVVDCTTRLNTLDGIICSTGCVIRGNTCSFNGNTGNGAGIHATSGGNRIEGNNCTDADRGIDVDFGGNIISKNTCSGNGTNWDIVAGNVCLVVQGVTGAAILGNTGGVAPGSTDPNANFSY